MTVRIVSQLMGSVFALSACLLLAGSLGAAPARVDTAPPDSERRLAALVLPSIADGMLERRDRTALGTSIPEGLSGGASWKLLRVDVQKEKVPRGGEMLVVVWVVPRSDNGELRFFVCDQCVAYGLAAIFRPGEQKPLAVSSEWIKASGREDIRPSRWVQMGRQQYPALIKRYRHRGIQSEEILVLRRSGAVVRSLGSIPIRSSNEGLCGEIEKVAATGKPIGGKRRCRSLWRLETSLTEGASFVETQEVLTLVSGSHYTSKDYRRKLRYRIRGSRLEALTESLWKMIPAH